MDRREALDEKAILLYSGGVDSSLAACRLLQNFSSLYLLFCDNGCMMSTDIVERRAEELRTRYSTSTIQLISRPTTGLFKRLALLPIESDIQRFNTNLVCLGCKLAAHSEAIILALETHTHVISDGYNSYQAPTYMEQRSEAVEVLKNFSAEYNLLYVNPIYQEESKKSVKLHLLEYGITPKSYEASCIFGDTYSTPARHSVVDYMYSKLAICREYIKQHLKGDVMSGIPEAIHKIGAIILRDKNILVVRKQVEGRTEYIIPGGRPEEGETHEDTLRRELREELQVKLESYDLFGSFSETAIFEGIPINMDVYNVTISGTPCCDSEIKDLLWIDRDYEQKGIKLGTVLSEHVIPSLIALDKM